jgi:hypothetical protein
MTKELTQAPNSLISRTAALFSKCQSILEKKNTDYAGAAGDPFKNFSDPELAVFLPEKFDVVELNLRAEIRKKFTRITVLFGEARKGLNESFDDTLIDMINYLAIWYSYRQERAEK